MAELLTALVAHESECRARIEEHDKAAVAERQRLMAALEAARHRVGNALAGLDNERIARALSILKLYGSYTNGGQDRASVIRDAVDWLATGQCKACRGLGQADFGTKSYDRWYGQRSDHEWGGPAHGSIIFQVGLKDRKRHLTEEEASDAIYLLLNLSAWEAGRENAKVAA